MPPPPQPTAPPGGTPVPQPTPTPEPPCDTVDIETFCFSDGCSGSEQMPIEVWMDCASGDLLDVIPLGGCGDLFCSAPTPAPPGEVGPCDPLTAGFGQGMFNCGGAYDLTATAYIGPTWVQREPYPNGLVTVPNRMALAQQDGQIGWSQYAMRWPAGVPEPDHYSGSPFQSIKDFRFGLQWRRAGVLPIWYFGDGASAGGWEVIHAYEQSSWGQGCRLNGLEAYCINTISYWLLYGVTEFEGWEQTRMEWSDCFWREEEPLGIPHRGCSSNECGVAGGWCGQVGEPYYEWVHHEDWQWIDLRVLGWPTEYFGGLAQSDRLPVLEAQGVIDTP